MNKGKKNPWQPAEDEKVLELIGQFGQSWAQIANALGNRTGKQVRDRYLNYLRSDINEEEFTPEEDQKLLSLFYEIGRRWAKIASYLPGRTECQVKNRYYTFLQKQLDLSEGNPLAIQEAPKLSTNKKVRKTDPYEEKKEFESQRNQYQKLDGNQSFDSSDSLSEPHNNLNPKDNATNFISYDVPMFKNNSVFPVTENPEHPVCKKHLDDLTPFKNPMSLSFNDENIPLATHDFSRMEEQMNMSNFSGFEQVYSGDKERNQRKAELYRTADALVYMYTKIQKEIMQLEREEMQYPTI